MDDTSDEDPSEDDSLMGDDTDMCAFHDVLASALVGWFIVVIFSIL